MTIHSLESAKRVVEEAGRNQVEAVFKYHHTVTKNILFAVFLKGTFIDIYQSPFCEFIETLFENGEWKDD